MAIILRGFLATRTVLLLTLLLGYLLGRLQNRRWRHDRYTALGRKLQLIAERNENRGYRQKNKRPSLQPWQKWLLGFFHWISPTLTPRVRQIEPKKGLF